jgi:metal-responsive CopG/Arc/MetJ family transcriptional regulator
VARFMISMPDEMLKKLDEATRKEHRSRSELLREAARRHLTLDSRFSKHEAVKDEGGREAGGCKKLRKKI